MRNNHAVSLETTRAMEIKALHENVDIQINGTVWSLHELMLALGGGAGSAGRLILSTTRTRYPTDHRSWRLRVSREWTFSCALGTAVGRTWV